MPAPSPRLQPQAASWLAAAAAAAGGCNSSGGWRSAMHSASPALSPRPCTRPAPGVRALDKPRTYSAPSLLL